MDVRRMMLKRIWVYTPIAWVWLIIACVIAFNAHNIPIIMNNFSISLILYMVATYIVIKLTEKYEINNEVK